jgi:hypothetical protein
MVMKRLLHALPYWLARAQPALLAAQGAGLGCASELDGSTDRPAFRPLEGAPSLTPGASSPPNSNGSGAPVFGVAPSGGDRSGSFEGEACVGVTSGAEVLPAVLQVLVDTSGSMNDDVPGTDGTKWTVTRDALLDAVDTLPDIVSLGVVFYPNVPQNADPCFDRQTAVPIELLGPLGSIHRQAIVQAFSTKRPDGGTPTHDAYQYAASELVASQAPGRRFIVLITDGVPTFSLGCVQAEDNQGGGFPFGQQQQPVDAAPLVGEAALALESGVRTFVIGAPGSEGAGESLSRMAEAGGTAKAGCSHQGPEFCHFDMSSENDLAAGLVESLSIIASAASICDYLVPDAPGGTVLDPDKVNLLYAEPGGDEQLIVQSADASCSDGWQYADNGALIRLCPSTCDRVRRGRGPLTLQFGCLTVVR